MHHLGPKTQSDDLSVDGLLYWIEAKGCKDVTGFTWVTTCFHWRQTGSTVTSQNVANFLTNGASRNYQLLYKGLVPLLVSLPSNKYSIIEALLSATNLAVLYRKTDTTNRAP